MGRGRRLRPRVLHVRRGPRPLAAAAAGGLGRRAWCRARASSTPTSSPRAPTSGSTSSATARGRCSAPTRAGLLAVLAPALLAFELALLPVAARDGWLRAKLRAQAAVLRSLPWALRRRRRVQALRRVPAGAFAAAAERVADSPYLGAAARDRRRCGACRPATGRWPRARGAGGMTAEPELSVVLVNYDGAGCLPQTLRALARAHAAPTPRASSSTPAPSDGSWRDVERHWDAARVLRFEHNIGFAAGLQPRRRGGARPLRRVRQFRRRGRARLGRAAARAARGSRASPWRPGCSCRRTARRSRPPGSTSRRTPRRTGARASEPRARGAARRRSAVTAASGALMMVRREDFLRLGGFFEPLWMYGEEADYCLRALERGARRARPGQRDPPRARARVRPAPVARCGCTGRAATA